MIYEYAVSSCSIRDLDYEETLAAFARAEARREAAKKNDQQEEWKPRGKEYDMDK